MLTRCLTEEVHADKFVVGRRPGSLARIFRVLIPLYDAIRLVGLLLSRRHDVYHVNPSLDPRSVLRDALFLIVLRAFRRKNTVVFFHGWVDDHYQRIAGNSWYRFLFRFAYSYARQTFVLTAEFARKLTTLGIEPENVSVTTTMFDGELLRNIQRNRQDRDVRIIFMSRFVATKGVYELLDAFGQVVELNRNIRLTLAGDGPESARMHRWCQNRGLDDFISFPGYVEDADKAQLLLDSDIFVLPSYSEGCPISLLEAMGAGLPVIVTATGAIPNIVTDGKNGLVLQNVDSLSIAAAIVRLVEDPDLREEMRRANLEKAWHHYEANRVSERLEKAYQSIARL